MPLQNRVDPLGQIFSSESRGTWTGNRGVIHKDKKIVAHYKVKYWITCSLKYKNYQRTVMTDRRWTELFFLDEATAFSAGHRPCSFCRHPYYALFKKYWLQANGIKYHLADESIKSIDSVLHQDRLLPSGEKRTFMALLSELPDGVMVQFDDNDEIYLYHSRYLLLWNAFGYLSIKSADAAVFTHVLTPKTMVEVLRLGYIVDIHESATKLIEEILKT